MEDQTRRKFIKASVATALSFYIFPRHVLGKGYIPPSDKLYIGGIGVGGQGLVNLTNAYGEDENAIVSLCDVDDRRSGVARGKWGKATYYNDWREMFDKEQKNVDAFMISTPDHNHAIQTYHAMQLGKAVYTETPLTHDVSEARLLNTASVRYKTVTQMGNQVTSSPECDQITKWIKADLIGDVAKVHLWANHPVGIKSTSGTRAHTPPELKWDLWIGTASYRHYDPNYLRKGWKGWTDFGTGNFGAHGGQMFGLPYQVLGLSHALSAQLTVATYGTQYHRSMVYPDSTHLHIEMATRDHRPPVEIIWYDGGLKPPRPSELRNGVPFGDNDGGLLFEGTKGKLLAGFMGRQPRLLPDTLMQAVHPVQPVNGALINHQLQWTNAVKTNKPDLPTSPFHSAGPLTEAILLGNLTLKTPEKNHLIWDNEIGKVTNYEAANRFLTRQYRTGWTI